MRYSHRAARAAMIVGLLVTLASPGCCVRKGFILRGDWSLEMNRLPWMSHNGDAEYECAGEGCDLDHEHCAHCQETDPGATHSHGEPTLARPRLHHRRGHHLSGEGELVPMEDPAMSAAEPAPAGGPAGGKFHPVPTRPALAPWPAEPMAEEIQPMEPPDSISVPPKPVRTTPADPSSGADWQPPGGKTELRLVSHAEPVNQSLRNSARAARRMSQPTTRR